MEMDRRSFLLGTTALAVAGVLPAIKDSHRMYFMGVDHLYISGVTGQVVHWSDQQDPEEWMPIANITLYR